MLRCRFSLDTGLRLRYTYEELDNEENGGDMMTEISVPRLKCLRCEHTWTPRKSKITICPKCKSPYWNKPRKQKAKINA